MPPNGSFESQSFNPFSVNEDLKDNNQGPDVNFCQTQISSTDTSYYIPNKVKFPTKIIFCPTCKHSQYGQSFESFREFLHSACFSFSAICLSETWCQPYETSN